MVIRSRAPVRIDFAGGWTDVALFTEESKGFVINAAISIYSYVTVKKLPEKEIWTSEYGYKRKKEMKTVAYIRISTSNQDLDNQRLAILDYAYQKRITIDEFVQAQVSSRKNLVERGVGQLLERLETGDALLVSELSRLGRSVGQIIQVVDCLIRKHIRFVAIKENIKLDGKQDLQTKVMVTMFGLFAEIERDLISERTKEGLAAAKAKGKLLGRPKGVKGKSMLDGKEEEIQMLLKKEVSNSSIAKIMEVSRTALHHFIKTRKLS